MVKSYEADLKAKYRLYLEKEGCFWSNVTGGNYSKPGDPDTIACIDGYYLAIEAKTPGETPTEEQILRKMQIIASGGMHMYAYHLEDVKDAVRRIRNGERI